MVDTEPLIARYEGPLVASSNNQEFMNGVKILALLFQEINEQSFHVQTQSGLDRIQTFLDSLPEESQLFSYRDRIQTILSGK
jgi:hypothetical protein